MIEYQCILDALRGHTPHMVLTSLMNHIIKNIEDVSSGFIGEVHCNDEGIIFLRYHTIYGFEGFSECMSSYYKKGYYDYIRTERTNMHFQPIDTGLPVICHDVLEYRQGRPFPEHHPIIHACIIYPLCSDGKVIGTIGLSRNEPFDPSLVQKYATM